MTTTPTDGTLGVLKRPNDAVDDELLVLWRDLEEGAEAVCVDRLQEPEELQPVLREVLKQNKTKQKSTRGSMMTNRNKNEESGKFEFIAVRTKRKKNKRKVYKIHGRQLGTGQAGSVIGQTPP